MALPNRLSNLRKQMEINRLDSVLLSSREDIFYYTGHRASEGNLSIVNKSGKPILFVSPLENDAEKLRGIEFVYLNKLEDMIKRLKNKTVGFDEFNLSSNRFINLHKHHIKLKKSAEAIKKPREIKDQEEIEHIKKAVSVTKKVLGETGFYGKREMDVANQIEGAFKTLGADKSFDTIIANGTASIHHMPGNTIIKNNKPTIFDLGARWDWYCCDVTRTYLGKSGKDWNKIWEDVSEMQIEIIGKMEVGITMKELEEVHQKLMKEKGYKIHHSFGHGLGLEVHEQITGKLKENMVITVEPGVYLKHKGGVRIEDTVLVKKGKPIVLSKSIDY